MAGEIYTVGHSNRSAEALLECLRGAGVEVLVDVRRRPASRRYPHFNAPVLAAALETAGIGYVTAGEALGGHRPAPPEGAHPALARALRGYAEHMRSAAFARALESLLREAGAAGHALMCAERLPERCHRSLIADRLTARGVAVVHLIAPGERRAHRLHPRARLDADGHLLYDGATQIGLDLR